MRPSLPRFGGHLGASVSALVDGQLDDESAERAWAHVHTCLPCRRLVEHEGWVKRQLAQYAAPVEHEPPDRLVGSLLHLDPAALAWAETDEIERRGRGRRRAGLVLVGAGSVSAAVLGLTTLSGGAPFGLGDGPAPQASLRGGTSTTPVDVVVSPGGTSVHGQLPGWTWGKDRRGVAHAHAAP